MYAELWFIAICQGPWSLSLVFRKPDVYHVCPMHARSQVWGGGTAAWGGTQ